MLCPVTSRTCTKKRTPIPLAVDDHEVCTYECAEMYAHQSGSILFAERLDALDDLFGRAYTLTLSMKKPEHKQFPKYKSEDAAWESRFAKLETAFRSRTP